MSGLINSILQLFGGGMPAMVQDTRPPAWPTADDVAMAQKYDLSYGSPTAPFVTARPSGKIATYKSADDFIYDWNKLGQPDGAQIQPLTKGQQDQLAQTDLAVKRSALAALGFDPRQFAMAAPEAPLDLNVAGVTSPKTNMSATTGKYPSTLAHEAMHRGIGMLQAAGMLPTYAGAYKDSNNAEEAIVRSMMLQKFGAVEKGRGDAGDEQVSLAEGMLDSRFNPRYEDNIRTLAEIEAAAAKLIAKRTPRGPR
jgi:hypothetical protein